MVLLKSLTTNLMMYWLSFGFRTKASSHPRSTAPTGRGKWRAERCCISSDISN